MTMHTVRFSLLGSIWIVLASGALLTLGCIRRPDSRSVSPSDLCSTHYPEFGVSRHPGHYEFVKPGVDWQHYDSIKFDGVIVRVEAEEPLRGDQNEAWQSLADFVHMELQRKLAEWFEIADAAGPTVLRLQASLFTTCGAAGQDVAVSRVTAPAVTRSEDERSYAIMDSDRLASAFGRIEFSDSVSGEIIAVMIDDQTDPFHGPFRWYLIKKSGAPATGETRIAIGAVADALSIERASFFRLDYSAVVSLPCAKGVKKRKHGQGAGVEGYIDQPAPVRRSECPAPR
jgi:hypothetical protein